MTDTVFTKVDYTLGSLMDAIEMGTIGLPDIQRPFVWKNTKVRNLFDSMFRGYPIGYLLFWDNAAEDAKAIGADHKQKVPSQLIVDGQQRLTSLYAVIKGVEVVRENYEKEKIEIAFNPLTGAFDVADAAIRQDAAYIPNISVLWAKDADLFDIVEDYVERLKATQDVTDQDNKTIRKAMAKVQNLLGFPFTSLTLSADIDEEQVSDVFVRINSEGKSLNQADFLLTLMSVFWDEGRAQLENFCREARIPTKGQPSSYNHFLEPLPDMLLRASIGLGFRRGRLKAVYSILRGKDIETNQYNADLRDQQFDVLKEAQAHVLDLTNWHDFMAAIHLAGFRSSQTISSNNNLIYSYTLYLIGRTAYGLDRSILKKLIARWFFMVSLTGRYTSSPETKMDMDLARFRGVEDAVGFVRVLESICSSTLTPDYWSINLTTDLATSSARSPSMFAYFASLNLLEARVLYSEQKVSDLMDPTTHAPRSKLERHHLFPKAYLKGIGVNSTREINQIANYTLVEWGDNAGIADKQPSNYAPELCQRFTAKDLERMHYWHALPDGWENMEYEDFLRERRELMASVIRDAYLKLTDDGGTPNVEAIDLDQLIADGETKTTEFKSSLRINLHTKEKDPKMELSVLKTIAAFINTDGGSLVIGVSDDGEPVGIEVDRFPSEDKMNLHLVNLLKDRIGAQHAMYIHPHFDDFEDQRVLAVECVRGKSPVFVKDGGTERFYVRHGAATVELTGGQTQQYIKNRFGL